MSTVQKLPAGPACCVVCSACWSKSSRSARSVCCAVLCCMPRHAMPCHAMLYYSMLCHAMLYYSMLYYSMLCHAMPCCMLHMPCSLIVCPAKPIPSAALARWLFVSSQLPYAMVCTLHGHIRTTTLPTCPNFQSRLVSAQAAGTDKTSKGLSCKHVHVQPGLWEDSCCFCEHDNSSAAYVSSNAMHFMAQSFGALWGICDGCMVTLFVTQIDISASLTQHASALSVSNSC